MQRYSWVLLAVVILPLGVAVAAVGEKERDELFDAADTDKDGRISYVEHMDASSTAAERLFTHLDRNRDGYISKSETDHALRQLQDWHQSRDRESKTGQ